MSRQPAAVIVHEPIVDVAPFRVLRRTDGVVIVMSPDPSLPLGRRTVAECDSVEEAKEMAIRIRDGEAAPASSKRSKQIKSKRFAQAG